MTINDYLTENFLEVDAKQFYRVLFPEGELDKAGAFTPGKYVGIINRITREKKENGKYKVYRYMVTDELDAIDTATGCDDFCICRPLSYAGKSATAENARYCYAIVIDVDKLWEKNGKPVGLMALWEKHIVERERIPKPTAIVSSGTGIHLYYMLETPIALYKNVAQEMQELKRELTIKIWHGYIVNIQKDSEIQQEGIYQGFRMPGTITKNGGRARAFMTGNRVTVEYLNKFVEESHKAQKASKQKKRKLSLEEAKEKYPDWYRNRVENGRDPGVWATNRRVYEWWKRKILEGAMVGHRYYCIMMLAIYAKKCSYYDAKHNPNPVTREELEKDSLELLDFLEGLTVDDKNHFSTDDIQCALEAFDGKWVRYPRDSVQKRTGIEIKANKRNGRTQETHLKIARATQEILDPEGNWRNKAGRRSKAFEVAVWRQSHKEGKKIDCSRETGIDYKTVRKWWDLDFESAVAESFPLDHTKVDILEKKTEILKEGLDKLLHSV